MTNRKSAPPPETPDLPVFRALAAAEGGGKPVLSGGFAVFAALTADGRVFRARRSAAATHALLHSKAKTQRDRSAPRDASAPFAP